MAAHIVKTNNTTKALLLRDNYNCVYYLKNNVYKIITIINHTLRKMIFFAKFLGFYIN